MTIRLQRHRSMPLSHNDDGLSVMEMVVAVGVTMVVLISSGAAFIKMGEAQRVAEGTDRGTQLVQDKLETIRKLPYNLVGCYTDDGPLVCPTTVPPTNDTSPVNASNGELVAKLGPTRPTLDTSGVAPVSVEDNVIGNATSGNKFKIFTVVTWADLTDPNRTGALATAPTPGAYTAKRVTVTASWTLGGKERSVTRQWLRTPTSTEVVPPTVGIDVGELHCPEVVPYCNINITQGQVLTESLTLSKPVVLTMTMRTAAISADVTVGGTTSPTIFPTNSGFDFSYTVPDHLVKPGRNTVVINVVTSSTPMSVTKVVDWRFPISTVNNYELLGLQGFADQNRVEATTAPASGAEPLRTTLCVGTDERLLRYTGVKFDEVAVDDLDGYTPPTLLATGISLITDENLDVTHLMTTADHPANVAAGGYVPPKYTSRGGLNRITWSYGFQPGARFRGTFTGNTSTISVTVSGVRPGDGAAAHATLIMPVQKVTGGVDACVGLP